MIFKLTRMSLIIESFLNAQTRLDWPAVRKQETILYTCVMHRTKGDSSRGFKEVF